ncbi:hypothetical protein [Sphingomonas guangdongensis]|uniref:hypothetical protein n=1 Tax=Sphingomonas guangdongensis TaxID=1141890 RepID=UPI000BE3E5A7|nr:hypothetical protein [Sphingomonas guangdongensis]
MGRKDARPIVWDTLVSRLRSHELQSAAAEGVFTAIATMARPADLPTLIDLLSDPALGRGRIFLVRNVMRSRRPEAKAALIRLKDDPDLATEIAARLSRAKPR